jgi:hypothetical protein
LAIRLLLTSKWDAVLLERSQSQVSETERRQDVRLSTLRSYVALGGELEVIASFGDKRELPELMQDLGKDGRRELPAMPRGSTTRSRFSPVSRVVQGSTQVDG